MIGSVTTAIIPNRAITWIGLVAALVGSCSNHVRFRLHWVTRHLHGALPLRLLLSLLWLHPMPSFVAWSCTGASLYGIAATYS